MRSDLVFEAAHHVPNRYQLCQLASKAARKMHIPKTRISDTTNYILSSLHSFNVCSACAVQDCNCVLRSSAVVLMPNIVQACVIDSRRRNSRQRQMSDPRNVQSLSREFHPMSAASAQTVDRRWP
jgi:hypothetical protein